MHPKTISSFIDELTKIAGVDAAMFSRIADKAAKRGWSGARETQSIRRLSKGLGRAETRAMGHHPTHSPTMFADTAIKAAPQNPTRVARPQGAAPAAGGTQAGVMPKSLKPAGNMRRNLALGGAAAAAGGLAGYSMGHQQ